MGITRRQQFHGFTVSPKWLWTPIKTDEALQCRRIGDVLRFDPPRKEAFTREDLDRDWDGDMDQTDEW